MKRPVTAWLCLLCLAPGLRAAPAVITIAPQVVLTSSNILTMEIGGRSPGPGSPVVDDGYDKLLFTHPGTPQITWGGTLVVELINSFSPVAGDAFDLFDFDPARDAGAFTSVTVVDHGLLPPGLAFSFAELYTTGIIRVISTAGTTFPVWAATVLGNPGALPGGNADNDCFDNLTEYALGLFPAFPGAAEPAGGFHTYPEGERLRVIFWRHFDRTDVTLHVQVSTDLQTWQDLAVSIGGAPFTGPGFVSENRSHHATDPGQVEVRDIVNSTARDRRFLRVHVALTP